MFKPQPDDELFIYTGGKRKSIKNRYLKWRASEAIPLKCDNEGCERTDKLELDHINGVNTDNRLKNLRLLCLECHKKTPTYGSKNKGRVQKSDGGFGILNKTTEKRNVTLPARSGNYGMSGGVGSLITFTEEQSND